MDEGKLSKPLSPEEEQRKRYVEVAKSAWDRYQAVLASLDLSNDEDKAKREKIVDELNNYIIRVSRFHDVHSYAAFQGLNNSGSLTSKKIKGEDLPLNPDDTNDSVDRFLLRLERLYKKTPEADKK